MEFPFRTFFVAVVPLIDTPAAVLKPIRLPVPAVVPPIVLFEPVIRMPRVFPGPAVIPPGATPR